jgi:hypothetical protein
MPINVKQLVTLTGMFKFKSDGQFMERKYSVEYVGHNMETVL